MATAESNMAKHLPAPSTFAPSRNDVLSSLSFFFGDPASPEKLRDYSEHQAQTYHFPDAFTGSNNRIRDTLNNLVLKVRLSVQTKCCVSCLGKYVLFVLSHTNALVMFLLPQSPQDWQTSVGLPFVQITGTVRLVLHSNTDDSSFVILNKKLTTCVFLNFLACRPSSGM